MSSFDILSAKFLRPRSSGFFLFSFLFLVALSPILFLFPQNVYAVDVTLAWDANSEEDLAGYRVFCRAESESYKYNDPDWEGDKTETSCTIYNLDDHTTYYFVVRAFDTSGNESGDSNEVCYQPNIPPTADAGPDQTVDEGDTVTLEGSDSSDPDGTIDFYEWIQTGGTAVTLSDATAAKPTFTAPDVGPDGETLTFELTVTDDSGLQDTDTCIVNVTWENEPPIANAVDQTVYEGQTVTLDSSGSYDPDGSIVSYSWTQTEGPAVTLSDPLVARPTFTAPAPGVGPGESSLTFRLTVTDNGGLQSTDTCDIDILSDVAPSLTGLSITGASSVNENSTSNYTATATFNDGSTETVTESAIWSEDSDYAGISDTGVLSTSDVTSDCTVTVKASYTFDSVTKTAEKMVTIVDVPESNLAPLDPVITSPDYYQIECDLLLVITTEPFSDPDGDLHSQSQWQISEQEDFSSLILDVTSTEHLTELPVPHLVLKPDTTYYVRVQFYDFYLEPSEWSDAIVFTTASYNNDVDENGVPGVPDDQEVDNSVNLNGDDTPDNNQPELIKCVQSEIGNVAIGVCKASDSITAIEAVETIDLSTISDKTNKPKMFFLELFSYRLRVNEPGATATVRVYFSKDVSKAGTFYKYDTINGWQDYSQHTTFGEDGRSVILEVKDGGYGDSDGIANRVIVDPGGLAEASSTDVETNSTSGDDVGSHDSGCFIATAAFGSYAEPHVKLLRDFRDQYLLTNMPGRWFVRMYYRYGPFWADLINIHTWCKPIIRLALMPLIGISYVLVKASVVTRILAGLMLALFALGCFLRMPGRPVTGGEQ